ncbi:MAG: argininosuccinate lyase [Thermoanaerobaculia bacterium]
MKHMWGGRFEGESSESLRRFNDSFSFDRELLAEDIEGSIAWAQALQSAGALTPEEAKSIIKALTSVAPPTSAALSSHEDVHSYVESKLRDTIGALAGKLHTGRSRNDQVATDLRLWLKKAAHEAQELVRSCMRVLAERAYEDAATPMPGYTHSKQAEPVTFGHWCLAYVEMLKRDDSRFADAIARADECPLGSGALSGTPLAIDRESLADSLGFARPSANSLDAVADRDFAAEYLFTCSLLLSHLSRLSEDLIFFSSDEARYVELPDSFATGSSRMPHKKNPDVLELVRGHAARSIGELTGLLALMKGIPLAYDKDLQLDKEPVFRMRGVIAAALPALTGLIAGLKLHRDRMRTTASNDLLLATELADALAARGIAFREAHEIVGRRLAESLRTGRSLRDLGPNAQITDDDLAALDVDRALAKRTAFGGTAPDRVRDAAKRAIGMARP